MPHSPSSDIAFTDAVKSVQTSRGARAVWARVEAHGGFRSEITDDLAGFIAGADTAYLATASADGQPYAQHRGGPKGFIKVVDARTLGFVDFAGNRQYITTGNLAENDRAFLFLMDYAQRRRIKLWGHARVVVGDDALQARLMPQGSEGRPEQVILFEVAAWDVNCPQHIPQKFDAADVATAIASLQDRIATLQSENDALRELIAPRLIASNRSPT